MTTPEAAPLSGITRRDWHELCDQLIELALAGALDGIRAVVAERLGQVRTGRAHTSEQGDLRVPARYSFAGAAHAELGAMLAGNRQASAAVAAALLAAEIDRMGGRT